MTDERADPSAGDGDSSDGRGDPSDEHPHPFGDLDDPEGTLQAHIDEYNEFLSWIGTRVEHIGEGTMTLAIPYDGKLTNSRPNDEPGRRPDMHGGIAATLIDTAGGLSLRTELENPLAATVATINLNVNYLRPATGDLEATADVVRVGSSIGVSEVVVESTTPDGEPKPVATGQGAYRIFRRD